MKARWRWMKAVSAPESGLSSTQRLVALTMALHASSDGGDVFDESTRCVAFGGKLMVVGFTSGRIAEISTNIPLIKGFSIVGLRAGEYARRFPERGHKIQQAISSHAEQGRITPAIDRVLPLSRWREGFTAMARRELVGKVVFQPG